MVAHRSSRTRILQLICQSRSCILRDTLAGFETSTPFQVSPDLLFSKAEFTLNFTQRRLGPNLMRRGCYASGCWIQNYRHGKMPYQIEVRPGHNILCDNISFFFVSTMHLSYYNCLSTIHRASVQHNSWNTGPERVFDWNVQTDSLNSRVYSNVNICLRAAHNIIDILDRFSQEGAPERINWIWYTFSHARMFVC
jgi:hypothetical protein